MGWSETDYDGENCEITEEEMREFEAMYHSLKDKQVWSD